MNLLGKGMDPGFWQEVREKECYKKLRDELFELWEKHCENVPIYALKYSDFRLFAVTGNRSVYEDAYFTRRQALNCSTLLSLIYPEEEKYIVRLMDEIYAICDEYTWCLPAHQTKLEINNNCHIDLFAAETGFALSEIYTLLGERLEGLIRDRIRVEIDRRIVIPFTAKESYGWWENGTNNWTAVCAGSVACTVMLMHPESFYTLLPRFEKSMERFLSGFSRDGICYEGCVYWHYGFGFFTIFADMLYTFTSGEMNYFARQDVRRIATFIQKMFLSGRAGVSFADARRTLSYHLALVHYLKNKYPDDVIVYSPDFSYNIDGRARFCRHLISFIWLDEKLLRDTSDKVCAEYYAPDAQWFIKRTPFYGFAVKGGCNNEHHNHNDVGSFIFAKNGAHVFTDPGAGKYTRQYFASDTRYTILECSSRGHSVPIINGDFQCDGKEFRASSISYENGVFTVDIAGAYDSKGLASLKRSFSFEEDSVTMRDTIDYSGEGTVTERFVTFIEPKPGEGKTVKVGDTVLDYSSNNANPVIGSEKNTQKTTLYFIDFPLEKGTTEFTCRIS